MQSRFQAAVHERRLARPGSSHYGKETRRRQFVDHPVHLVFPAKKQVFLILPEGP
jgi:hypothetical protein